MPIKLGQKVRDKVSGFEGIACATTLYLGCNEARIGVQAPVKEGKLPDVEWFYEPSLTSVDSE